MFSFICVALFLVSLHSKKILMKLLKNKQKTQKNKNAETKHYETKHHQSTIEFFLCCPSGWGRSIILI